jgi:hydrogenase maturation factor
MCLAVPGKVVEILGEGELRMGKVDFSGVKRQVSLAFVPEVQLREIGELGETGSPEELAPSPGRRGEG